MTAPSPQQQSEDELLRKAAIAFLYPHSDKYAATVSMRRVSDLVQLIKANREQYGREQRIASVQLYMDTCEENSCDPSWPTIHEFQDGQRKAMDELHPEDSRP